MRQGTDSSPTQGSVRAHISNHEGLRLVAWQNARKPDVQWRALNARPRLSTVILSLTRAGGSFKASAGRTVGHTLLQYTKRLRARAWMSTTLSPPCLFCGPDLGGLYKMDGTALSLHDVSTSHSPPPQFLCTPGTPPPALSSLGGCVSPQQSTSGSFQPIYVFSPWLRFPPLFHVGLKRRSWAVCFFSFWSPTSFLPQGPLGWIHFAEFLDQPGWMAGNILACYLPGDSVSPAASSQEPESNSLGSERERKGSLLQLFPWNDPGHRSEMDPGVKPAPPLSSLVTWNKLDFLSLNF